MFGKSKILDTDKKWFFEIDPASFYEKNLENTILSQMESIYPNYLGVPFAIDIANSEGEIARPDFVLIRKDYQEWYVVEVELSRHSWDDHIEKQVRVFSTGIYEKEHIAGHLFKKDSSLDIEKLEKMVDEHYPKVMVVVNEKMIDWGKKIKKYNAILSVFQIYKGTEGFDVYRVEGETPLIVADKSHCMFTKGGPNILEVFSPEIITECHNSEIEISYKGRITKWVKKESKNRNKRRVYLILKGLNYLPIENKYVLTKSKSNEYYLEIN